MKSLVIIVTVILAISYIPTQLSCNGKTADILQPTVTIADIETRQSVFADSLVSLHQVKIQSCQTILNYTKAVITDGSKGDLVLLTNKPYKKGEVTDIKGRLFVLYQLNEQRGLVFIDNGIKPAKSLLQNLAKLSFKLN